MRFSEGPQRSRDFRRSYKSIAKLPTAHVLEGITQQIIHDMPREGPSLVGNLAHALDIVKLSGETAPRQGHQPSIFTPLNP